MQVPHSGFSQRKFATSFREAFGGSECGIEYPERIIGRRKAQVAVGYYYYIRERRYANNHLTSSPRYVNKLQVRSFGNAIGECVPK
jgi:hypothetical protein